MDGRAGRGASRLWDREASSFFTRRWPAKAGHLKGAPTVDVSNYSQGAIRAYGAGRIAVFGEAGAFSAQIEDDGNKIGMNADGAEDNAGFVLKVMRWLARYVPPAR